MKKLFILIATALFVACSNQEYIESNPSLPTNDILAKSVTKSNIRSYDDALKIAQSSISMLDGSQASTRGMSHSRKIDLNASKVFKLDAKTRSASGINDTLIYVFNFENNEGFTLISASKRTSPILAITEKGHCDPSVRSSNEGFNLFVYFAEKYVAESYLWNRDDSLETEYYEEYVFSNEIYTGPYIPVTWGQNNPMGEYFSNGLCGCVTTAIAQMMAYYEHPASMLIEFGEEYGQTRYFNWTAMKAHTGTHSYANCSQNQKDAHKSISILCKNIGLGIESTCEPNGTFASGPIIRYYIGNYFSIDNTWHYYNNVNIKWCLNNEYLMFINGSTWDNDVQGYLGHMWLIDGYLEAMCTTYLYGYQGNPANATLLLTTGPTAVTLYHYNWGWDGYCNGYYDGGVFNYISSMQYDNPNTSFSNNDPGMDFNTSVILLPVYGIINNP